MSGFYDPADVAIGTDKGGRSLASLNGQYLNRSQCPGRRSSTGASPHSGHKSEPMDTTHNRSLLRLTERVIAAPQIKRFEKVSFGASFGARAPSQTMLFGAGRWRSASAMRRLAWFS